MIKTFNHLVDNYFNTKSVFASRMENTYLYWKTKFYILNEVIKQFVQEKKIEQKDVQVKEKKILEQLSTKWLIK